MKKLIHFFLYYAEVYRVQIKNNWVREAVYRKNFLTSTVVDSVWIGVELGLFSVIYANTPTLGGWNKEQVFFFLGIFFSSDALFTTFFQRNFWMFSDLVNKGELDILLTKPIHPLFLALTRWMSITSIFNMVLGLAVAARYAHAAGFPGGPYWIVLFLWLFVGLATQILLRFTFAIWIFWTERSFALSRMYYQFFTLATKPDVLYPKFLRYLILTFLPFAFISSVPTRALTQGLALGEYAQIFLVLSAFAIIDGVLWHRGLLRYQSASS